MKTFKGRTAVITGAGSGFSLEVSRIAAREGMQIVMADVQQDALDRAAAEITALGAQVLPMRVDVSKAEQMEALGEAALQRFGAPHFVFNNAGIGAGGLIWEHSLKDWEWVIGVNLMGVAHGVRIFTPAMLKAAKADPDYEGHIVNTASMAGLLNTPNMGVYNVTKHAVVSLSETLYHDLSLVTEQIGASVLCRFPLGAEEVVLRCRVRWIDLGWRPGVDLGPGAGVEFIGLGADERARLQMLVAKTPTPVPLTRTH